MHCDDGTPNRKCISINFQCGFQRRNAFILFQEVLRTTRQIDLNQKSPTDNQTNGQTDILYCYSENLSPWPEGCMLCAQLQAVQMNFYCQLKAVSK